MSVAPIDGASSAFTTATTTFAIPAPATGGALAAGDVLVANVVWDTGSSTAPTVTPPSDWVPITGVQAMGTGTTAMHLAGVAHVVTSAEAASPPASWAVTTTTAYVGHVAVARFRGVDTADLLSVSTPAAGYSLAAFTTAVSSKPAPLVTVDTAGSMLVTGSMHRSNSTTITSVDTGYTIAASVQAQTAGRAGGLAYKTQTGTGDSTAATWVTSTTNTGAAWQAALKPAAGGPPAAPTPVLAHRVLGIPTATVACMAARTTGAVSARMQVSPSATFASGVISGSAVSPNTQGDSQLTVSGLTAGTSYYQRVAMTNADGVETYSAVSGKPFKTAPTGPASFTFAFASCDSAADTTTWTTVANRSDDFFLMLGDLYYADGTGTDLANFRAKMVAKLQATNHVKVFAATPTLYGASDHDGMNNGSTAGADPTAWANWNTAYRELFPNPGIPTGAVYKTFTWGRVRFIQIDTRSFASDSAAADNSAKTRLGATQKQWLKDTITSAAEPVIVLVQADPWIGAKTTGDVGWLSYDTERQELGSFFAASGKSIAMLAGDMHALAADDGSSVNNPGHIAVFHGSPMQNTSSLKGGPYTVGPYPSTAGVAVRQYSRIVVTDTGNQISLGYTGYDDTDTQLLTLAKTYTVQVATGRVVDRWDGAALVRRRVDRWNGAILVQQSTVV